MKQNLANWIGRPATSKKLRRFSGALQQIFRRLLDQPVSGKEDAMRAAFRRISSFGPAGDYVEFGVWRGRSFVLAWDYARRNELREMKFFAFDSFEGLSEPSSIESSKFTEGQFQFSQEAFELAISAAGVDLSRVEVVPGFFRDSLSSETRARLGIQSAAIVWIDCDLLEPSLDALEFVRPFLKNGTCICFDDWFSFSGHQNAGEIAAVREFLRRHPEVSLIEFKNFEPTGKIFLVHLDTESLNKNC